LNLNSRPLARSIESFLNMVTAAAARRMADDELQQSRHNILTQQTGVCD
jgi:hypothetical protein